VGNGVRRLVNRRFGAPTCYNGAEMKRASYLDIPFVPAGHEDPNTPAVWKKTLFQKGVFQNGTIQMVNWSRLPAGQRFAKHYHEDMQELFVVISGEVEMTAGNETVLLRRGDAVIVEPGEIHQMHNAGTQDAEYLAIGQAPNTGGRTVIVREDDASQKKASAAVKAAVKR
jgi:mannose-6-phosphate isomerase-like protein (cupin superfamily)